MNLPVFSAYFTGIMEMLELKHPESCKLNFIVRCLAFPFFYTDFFNMLFIDNDFVEVFRAFDSFRNKVSTERIINLASDEGNYF